MVMSSLQKARLSFQPKIPPIFDEISKISCMRGEASTCTGSREAMNDLFPNLYGQPYLELQPGEDRPLKPVRIGVVLSGGQAPGGHNVIMGLWDALKQFPEGSALLGFVDGPRGILKNHCLEINEELVQSYRNQGGFHMIGSGRDKISTSHQCAEALETVKARDLDGLVIVGGDDSNTNAGILAEYFLEKNCQTVVVGVPKTIDGDLKNDSIETSFGFDTACKVYSELIGNIMMDVSSSKKYYHWVRLMGRAASHITLECALQTRPNIALIGEEVLGQNLSLRNLVERICDVICERAALGKNYGVILVPEGLIEFVPELRVLINQLNDFLASDSTHMDKLEKLVYIHEKVGYVANYLSPNSVTCFRFLPESIQAQLLFDRDPHGNVQVSRIETERLLDEMVQRELALRKKVGHFGGKYSSQSHFFGYEGRSALPSNFDCQYCYALGHTAASLIAAGCSGYMACVSNLSNPSNEWRAAGVPLVSMMHLEQRQGSFKPVIQKAMVDLKGPIFSQFSVNRHQWALEDDYCAPGPIQFYGDEANANRSNLSLELSQGEQRTGAPA